MDRPIGKLERLCYERHERDLALAAGPNGHPKGYYYDPEEAERIIVFLERYCRHFQGDWAGQPLALGEWQKRMLRILFGWLRANGSRRFREAWIEIARKNGKALALDTRIPTPSGWMTMGELSEGDVVFDEGGEPCRVVFVTPVMHDRQCYRVTFSDGTSIVADAEHQWYTEARRTGLPRTGLGPKSSWAERHIRTTEQIRETLVVQSGERRVEWNHRVPVAASLRLPETDLPIPPYTLGAWLGDGHSSAARVTCGHVDAAQVLGSIRADGFDVSVRDARSGCTTYALGSDGRTRAGRATSLGLALRRLGVFRNKHIPAPYMRGSRTQRLSLLQGLMDTDGTASRAGQCTFTTTTPALRDGVMELLRSLGFKPSVTDRLPRLKGHESCARAWTVQFWAYQGDAVFRLSRKLARLKVRPPAATRASRRQIVAVDPVPSVPVRCIQVDSQSHLYLAGEGMVPTHNTLLAAGIGLYLLIADSEPGGEVYVTATTKKQALICHKAARKMAAASPALAKRVRIPKAESANLVYEKLGAKMEILSSDWGSTDGLNPSGDIRDEVHEWKAEELAAKLDTALGARRQPLTVKITTAGVYDPTSIGWKDHDYAVSILEGTVEDDEVFVFIAAIDDDDDWTDAACRNASPDHSHPSCVLRKANPNLGISPSITFLNGEIAQALQRTDKVNDVLRYYCNRWTQQAERWLDLERWKEAESATLTEAELVGLPCVGGLDLADKIDLCAFVLAFEREDGWLDFLCRFWLPEERIKIEAKRQRQFFAEWATAGWLTATPGEVIDFGLIRREINALRDAGYAIGKIGYDPARATQLSTELREEDGFAMVEVRQGTLSLHEPSKLLEAKIIQRRARATGPPGGPNPAARWMVGNATKRTDANMGIAPDKKRSKDKIDFVAAAVDALAQFVGEETAEHVGDLLLT